MCLPYNLNTLSQVAAEAAFDDQAFLARTVSQNAEERAKWEGLFDELGIHYYKSEANFIFFEAPDADADGLANRRIPSAPRSTRRLVATYYSNGSRWRCNAAYIKTIHELIIKNISLTLII